MTLACRSAAIYGWPGDPSFHRLLIVHQSWRPLHTVWWYATLYACIPISLIAPLVADCELANVRPGRQSGNTTWFLFIAQHFLLQSLIVFGGDPMLAGCAGTIAKLGTKKHHAEFLPRLDTLDLPGCFG